MRAFRQELLSQRLDTGLLFLEHAGHVAFVIALLQRLAFIILLLTTAYPYNQFGITFIADEQAERDDCETRFLPVFL